MQLIISNLITVLPAFFLLVAGHALADFGLQSEWLARSKKRKENPNDWYISLTGHGFIHGLFVALILSSPLLGLFEVVAHSLIDFGKTEEKYGIKVDQALHLLCKLAWVGLALAGIR